MSASPARKRGSGQTLEMVQHLPDDSIVIVHSAQMIPYLKNMIADVRGVVFMHKTRIVVVDSLHSIDRLRGTSRPIRVDHAFWNRRMTGESEAVDYTVRLMLEHQGR